METFAPISWLPEDDLELKNAVEKGASLEALAKGAAQFSRRFSLKELRDRWYSLLYDPGVSVQASAHMFELEISKFNRSDSNLKGNKEIPKKRKSESLRKKYYAMRKKYRSDIFNNADLGFFEPNPQFTGHVASDFHKQGTLDVSPLGQSSMLGDHISELIGLQEEELDFLRQAFPETARDMGGTSGTANFLQAECPNSFEENHANGGMGNCGFGEDISSLKQGGTEMTVANIRTSENPLFSNIIYENPNNSSVPFVDGQIFDPSNPDDFASFQTDMFASSDQPHLRHWRLMQDVSVTPGPVGAGTGNTAQVTQGFNDIEGKENSSLVYTGEFADPDSLLNLSVGDELLLDVDDTEDKSLICKVEPGSIKVAETSSVTLSSAHPAVLEVVPLPKHGDQKLNVHPVGNVSVKPASDSDFSEPNVEKMICTFNTEDPEIPCNDDIFLLIHPSATFCGSAAQPNIITPNDASSGAREKGKEQAVIIPAKTKTSTIGCSQKIRTQGLSVSNTVKPVVGRSVKTELHDSRPQTPVPVFANKTTKDSSKGKSLYPIPNGSHDRVVEKDGAGFPMRVGGRSTTVNDLIQSTETAPGRIVRPEILDDCAVSNQEEPQIEDDVPYFSDVEAMLLDMDLEPVEHDSQVKDSQVIQQVPSYQHDETKRTIIRLEQATLSCLHRAMTSKGALAILYGRHLRHYIDKPEVLLGRSTNDTDVDIDLQKEGRANKISRRQATIKLEEDGSFSIQNLGKSSVSVNGVPVATGQFLTLSSGCLIEIRGMWFVFEINERYLKQQLGKYIDRIRGRPCKTEY